MHQIVSAMCADHRLRPSLPCDRFRPNPPLRILYRGGAGAGRAGGATAGLCSAEGSVGESDNGAADVERRRFDGAGVGAGTGGAMVAAASRALDFRSLISMRRRCGTLAGTPSIAKVSSVFMSCAPERGMILNVPSSLFCLRTLTTDTARANPKPALSAGMSFPTSVLLFKTESRSRSRLD